jgi:hypothetical protein
VRRFADVRWPGAAGSSRRPRQHGNHASPARRLTLQKT